ncbi:MAG: hypothetical protein EP330_01755 [Deltaproteobacteria bacterium]|nr:MAG: hypothetical protein EP330_01755 [Deltaproteobacteria bacterium]
MHTLLRLTPLLGVGCLALYDPCELDEGNLLGDSEFEALTCWFDGTDDGVWPFGGLDDSESSPGSGSPVFRAENVAQSETYAVQILQGGDRTSTRRAPLDLEPGDDVAITFLAKADPPRSIIVQLADDSTSSLFETQPIGGEWASYTVNGTIIGGDMDFVFLDIQLGGDPGVVYLDDVVLEVIE